MGAEGSFDKMAEESRPYDKVAEVKQKCAKLRRALLKSYLDRNELTYQLQLRDQKINELYRNMYYLAELPRDKKDRERIYSFIQKAENREGDWRNDDFSFMSQLLPELRLRSTSGRPRRKIGYIEDFSDDFSANTWWDDLDGEEWDDIERW